MLVLGIETSCDETGVALYDGAQKKLVAQALHTQIPLHQRYGGVVPELASRDHVNYLVTLVNQVCTQAGISINNLHAIAYTAGPGLVGALLTGACFAKSLALSLNIPAIAVHHLEAHILVAQLANPSLSFPFLALLVSGGHTQLIHAHHLGNYEVLGDTLDDAVGEAFDKTAKLMGIPYPGGAQLARLADQFNPSCDVKLAPFPRPMLNRSDLNFSFSGLKTHALITWNRSEKDESTKRATAAAFQEAVVAVLRAKCGRALKMIPHPRLVVAGGVGANQALRETLTESVKTLKGEIYFPPFEYCTDNGAMIAYTGYLYLQQGKRDMNVDVHVKARWPLTIK